MSKQDCPNSKTNNAFCKCSYEGCSRHGLCCECLQYHLGQQQLPACCFSPAVERTYDRSFRKFVETHRDLLAK